MKWNITLAACCLVLVAINIALIRQNRQLKAQISLPAPNLQVATGVQVPDLKGFDLGGKPLEVAYGRDPRKVLVLVYSPTCHFCDENWPRWWDLISALDRDLVRPVAVDVTSTSTAVFLVEHRLRDFPIMNQVDPNARINYHFQLTPQTILVDQTGKVEKVWSGVLDNSALQELKQRTGAKKPDSTTSGTGF